MSNEKTIKIGEGEEREKNFLERLLVGGNVGKIEKIKN